MNAVQIPPPTRLVTPKDFVLKPRHIAETKAPTGLHEYQRVRLSQSTLPTLGNISLWEYYYLRIACCGTLLVAGADKLRDCDHCHDNRGYRCPICLGATWVKWPNDRGATSVACPGCRVEYPGEKGAILSEYDAERELATVQRWLARKFPMGVSLNSLRDIQLADSFL